MSGSEVASDVVTDVPLRRLGVELRLPPKAAAPDYSEFARGWADVVRNYRAECMAKLRALRAAPFAVGDLDGGNTGKVRVSYEFFLCKEPAAVRGRYLPTDEAGARAAMNAALMAIADAGLIPGDGTNYLLPGTVELHTTHETHGGQTHVLMSLEEVVISKLPPK